MVSRSFQIVCCASPDKLDKIEAPKIGIQRHADEDQHHDEAPVADISATPADEDEHQNEVDIMGDRIIQGFAINKILSSRAEAQGCEV